MNVNLFSDCAYENKILYFYSALYGFAGRWDIFGNNQIKYCDLLGEPHNFIRTVSHHGKLYSLESSGKAMYILDVESSRHDVLKIPYNTYEYGNFMDFLQYNNKIYIFPRHQNEIMIVDIASETSVKVQYDASILDTPHCGCRHKNYYYIFPEKAEFFLSIELNGYQKYRMKISRVEDRIVHCTSYGEAVFLLTTRGKIYRLDTTEMILAEICDLELPDPAGQIVVTECRIIVLPYHQGCNIYIWDRNTRESYVYSGYPEDFCYQAAEAWNAFEGMEDTGEFYVFAMRSTNYALLVHKVSGEMQWKCPRNIDGQIVRSLAESGPIFLNENKNLYGLRDYIGYVAAID